jgi:signal transduction histidine kinase
MILKVTCVTARAPPESARLGVRGARLIPTMGHNKRQLWMAAVAALILAVTALSLWAPPGPALTTFADLTFLALLLVATAAMSRNGVSMPRFRAFWLLMAFSCLLWAINAGFWAYYEVLLRRDLPDPSLGDVILFLHVVPLMAAVALRPHRFQGDRPVSFDTLNFLMLLVWWVCLYAFIVFPDEYVVLHPIYSSNYNLLYLLENLVLLLSLGLSAASSRGAWRRLYWNLLTVGVLYTLSSETINAAIDRGQYHTGSIYDVPLLVAAGWMVWVALLAHRLPLEENRSAAPASRWMDVAPRVAMLAILSLPLLGLWALFLDPEAEKLRNFRILVTVVATLLLGLFVLVKQFLLDRRLIRLLRESRRSYERLERLQSQLVQREKLTALSQLVAGAAHEINNPLTAILGYSELLAANPALQDEQVSLAHKIGQQARRTRDLVSDLLSFAQQSPAEKALVDLPSVLQRALQVHEVPMRGKNIRVEISFEDNLPRIWGNSNQLLRAFLHLIENAVDALEEVGGGSLFITALRENDDVLVRVADTGPGMRDPGRVFDPFYTTKPVGKGTGLGLSATYGVVQDHLGEVSCYNRPEGGAVFVLRFAVASEAAAAKAAQF